MERHNNDSFFLGYHWFSKKKQKTLKHAHPKAQVDIFKQYLCKPKVIYLKIKEKKYWWFKHAQEAVIQNKE